MDCSLCTWLPEKLRPRHTICGACYEGGRSIISFINKLETHKIILEANDSPLTSLTFCKTMMDAFKWAKNCKDKEEQLNEKMNFLSGIVAAFRDQVHTDILVKPGDDGPSVPAHRALLAVRSEILKNMLESDGCKAPATDTITLGELKGEELETLLEFLYGGSLPPDKLQRHLYSLSLAADKYEIPYLQKLCESFMLNSLNSCNALDVLEVAETCSYFSLRDAALSFIVRHMEDIVFTDAFEAFALKNPHLSVVITRASLMDAKKNRASS